MREEKSVEIISISEDLTNIKISSNAYFNKQNIEALFSNLSVKIVGYEVIYKIKIKWRRKVTYYLV